MFMALSRFRVIAGLLMLSPAVVVGCSRQQPAPLPPKPPEVLVAVPISREVTDHESVTGRTEAVDTVDVRARVTGYLKKVDFKDGTEVREGDLLFQIDPDPYEAELARAEANVSQSVARVKRLEADYQRAASLAERNATSKADLDKVQGDLDEARAMVDAAKAARKLAEINLTYTRVVAPFDGFVSRRFVDPGNLIKADETSLTSIVRIDVMYVYFAVDERTLLRIRRTMRQEQFETSAHDRMSIQVGLADEPDFPHEGAIDFVDNRLDPATGTLRLRGVVSNAGKLLSPGLFVRVRVQVGKPYTAVLVPERALGSDQGQKFLYVVNGDNQATFRHVKVGSLHEGLRVVTQGLEPGERVIVSGLQRVRPGMQVEPKMTEVAEKLAGS